VVLPRAVSPAAMFILVYPPERENPLIKTVSNLSYETKNIKGILRCFSISQIGGFAGIGTDKNYCDLAQKRLLLLNL
jgi:hypothetical protein